MLLPHRRAHAGELSNVLREAGHPVPAELLRFGTHVKKKESKLYGNHFKDIDVNAKATKTTFADDSD
jgi:ATP-dependent RNA helicase DBP3